MSWSDTRIGRARLDQPKTPPLLVQFNFTQPEPKVDLKPQPIEKKEIKAPPKPKPITKPKKRSKKKIVQPQKQPEQIKPPMKKTPTLEPTKEEVAVAQPLPPKAQPKANHLEIYLAKVMSSIEQKKRYPTLARRKNIQGRVKVSFKLACDGKITELDISGSHNLLRKATNKAIKAAHPFPKMPEELNCPLPVSYAMAYTLNH
jgi:protein TonB